jgi:hypothetical protein
VWADEAIATNECPVRSMTAEVKQAIAWFYLTHEVETVGMGGLVWRLRRLPRAGGLEDQDAWLMEALAYLRAVANELLMTNRKPEDEGLREWHDKENKRERR